MGAAASIEQDWSEEEVVQLLLPHYVRQPEKCLRVHNALVQLVMLEKERMLSQRPDSATTRLKGKGETSRSRRNSFIEQEKERERALLAKKEQLEQEIEKKRKNSLNKQVEAWDSTHPSRYCAGSRPVGRFSRDIVNVLNMVRTDPPSLIPYAEEHLNSFLDEYSYKDPFNRPNTSISTKEGRRAITECIQFLRETSAVPPVEQNLCLENAACEYAEILIGCIDVTAPPIGEHIRKYGNWRGSIGQTISYGNKDAISIILSLVIDDGSTDKGHRKSVFDPNFLQVGAAFAEHEQQKTCCVIEFANTVLDWSTQQQDDTIVSFSTSIRDPDHDESLFRKVLLSIPNDNIMEEVEELLSTKGKLRLISTGCCFFCNWWRPNFQVLL